MKLPFLRMLVEMSFPSEPLVRNMVRMLRTSLEEGPVSLLHRWICTVLSSVTSIIRDLINCRQ